MISLLMAVLLGSLPPPPALTTCSPGGAVCATGDGERLTARVGDKVLWRTPTSMLPVHTRDDSWVLCIDHRLGHLPAYDPNVVVVQAFKDGVPLHPFRLGDLASSSQMREGLNLDWTWGAVTNFFGDVVEVELADHTKVRVNTVYGNISRPMKQENPEDFWRQWMTLTCVALALVGSVMLYRVLRARRSA